MQDHRMLGHIVDHSRQVCRVAVVLAENLKNHKVNISRELVEASALLHDITKTRSFETGENHAETGAALLTALGYPEVGNIVRQHVKLDTYIKPKVPREPEIVNYADKRVLHDRIVPLSERMDYILKKYGTSAERRIQIRWLTDQSEDLEKQIFGYCPFSPDDIGSRVKQERRQHEKQTANKPGCRCQPGSGTL